jgi:hypothetical protein
MRTIRKYKLEIQDYPVVHMPKGAEIIHVDSQKGNSFLWAIVNLEADPAPYCFCLLGTGQAFTGEEGAHIATFLIATGRLIFHLFERVPK